MSDFHAKMSALKRLNSRQRVAVTYGMKNGRARQHRPLLIVAGAGTGKTRVLAIRTSQLVACGAAPDRMFIASFTRKASEELVERARSLIKAELSDGSITLPYAGTFHSIANKLLREFGPEIGLRKSFTVLDSNDARDLMALVTARLEGIDGKETLPKADVCCAVHSYSRNANLSLKATLRLRFSSLKQHSASLRAIFVSYAEAKRSQNVLDYDDLLTNFVALLKNKKVGAALRNRFQYVVVDEFQDTNRLQFEIIRLLKPDGRGVTVVGDDAQAIYSFRAATVENIREFATSFPYRAKVVSLVRSYRSNEVILKAANAVISLSRDAFNKQLWSKRKSDELPLLTTVTDERRQAKHVVQTTVALREQGIPLGQQAVLIRASKHSLALEVELSRAKIPFRKWGGIKFMDAAHIKDVLAVLRWHQNSRDQVAGFRALQLLDGVGATTANRILQQLKGSKLCRQVPRLIVPASAAKQWDQFGRFLRNLSTTKWPGALQETVRWYRPRLERLYDVKLESRAADLDHIVGLGAAFKSCNEFLADLVLEPPAALAERDRLGDDADVLTLSTIHSAKGLEWKSVVILSVMEGCIPIDRVTTEEGIEEERRLLYVAMTRARDRLELVVPRRHFEPGARNISAAAVYSCPSRFIPASISHVFEAAKR